MKLKRKHVGVLGAVAVVGVMLPHGDSASAFRESLEARRYPDSNVFQEGHALILEAAVGERFHPR